MHGIITHSDGLRPDDHLYRVALKAIIFNENNEVLLVKETKRDWWDFPGGGIDHGESIKQGLGRELNEEVSYEGNFDFEPVHVSEPHILPHLEITQIRITFLVIPTNFNFKPGVDGDEIQFVDPNTFKDSEIDSEQKIYKYSQLAFSRLK